MEKEIEYKESIIKRYYLDILIPVGVLVVVVVLIYWLIF